MIVTMPSVFPRTETQSISCEDQQGEKNVSSLYRAPVLGGNPERMIHDIGSDISFSPDRARVVFIRYKHNEGEGRPDHRQRQMAPTKNFSPSNPPVCARLHGPPTANPSWHSEYFASDAALTALDIFDAATGEKTNL